VVVHNLSYEVIFLFLIGLAQLVTIHSITHVMYGGVTHTSRLNSHMRAKRLFITKPFKNSPVTISYTTNNTISRNLNRKPTHTKAHKQMEKVESTGSHALTLT